MPVVVRNVSRTTGAAPLRSSVPLISVEAARFLLASGCTQNVSVTSLIVTALLLRWRRSAPRRRQLPTPERIRLRPTRRLDRRHVMSGSTLRELDGDSDEIVHAGGCVTGGSCIGAGYHSRRSPWSSPRAGLFRG